MGFIGTIQYRRRGSMPFLATYSKVLLGVVGNTYGPEAAQKTHHPGIDS